MTGIQNLARSLLCLAFAGVPALAQLAEAQSPAAKVSLASIRDPAVDDLLKRHRSANDPREAQRAFEDIRALAPKSSYASYVCGVLAARSANAVSERSSAHRCFEDAAKAGIPEAQYRLAILLLEDGARQAEAERWLRASADSLPESVYLLALLAADRGADATTARRAVIEKAANAGFALAQFELARMLSSAPDANERKPQVRDLLERAAAQRHPEASVDLAVLLEQDKRDADVPRIVELLTVAAAGDSPRGSYALGVRYLNANGVRRDTARAFTLIRQAALGGRIDAQYALAYMLGNGTGTASDDKAAMEWLARAADQGHAEAMHGLGNYYANGWGVGKSLDVAFDWYCKAAQHGNAGSAQLISRSPRASECALPPARKAPLVPRERASTGPRG